MKFPVGLIADERHRTMWMHSDHGAFIFYVRWFKEIA